MNSSQLSARSGQKDEGLSHEREGGAADPSYEGLLKSRVFWGGALIGWLLLMPQLSLYARYRLATWPFGNMIAGIDELRIEFGLTSVDAGLAIFPGFFVGIFLFLLNAAWWRRVGGLLLFLALHAFSAFVSQSIYEGVMASSKAVAFRSVPSLFDVSHYISPLVGCVSVLLAVVVQTFFGWQIVHRSQEAARSQVSLARLLEGVAVCAVVMAALYSLLGVTPGAKFRFQSELISQLVAMVCLSIVSVAAMRLMIGANSVLRRCLWCALLAAMPVAVLMATTAIYYLVARGSMSYQDASLMGFAFSIGCLVIEFCATVCWLLAGQTGYRLLTKS